MEPTINEPASKYAEYHFCNVTSTVETTQPGLARFVVTCAGKCGVIATNQYRAQALILSEEHGNKTVYNNGRTA